MSLLLEEAAQWMGSRPSSSSREACLGSVLENERLVKRTSSSRSRVGTLTVVKVLTFNSDSATETLPSRQAACRAYLSCETSMAAILATNLGKPKLEMLVVL